MQDKFKSKVFWFGVFSVLMLVMGNYGLYDLIGIPSDTFGTIVKLVLDLVFGSIGGIAVYNNPNDPDNF